MNNLSARARGAAILLFLFSGATSLVYEVLWTRQFQLILGATTYSAGVVLAAYMAGLFLGSRWGARWAGSFTHPLKLYGLLEFSIGLYALLLALAFHGVDRGFLQLETHWPLASSLFILPRFLGSLALLIVPTTLMGATLPCLSNLTEGSDKKGRSFAGALYAVNTSGAVLGAVAAGYWLLPTLGQRHTTFLAAGVNLVLGLIGWWLGGRYSTWKGKLARVIFAKWGRKKLSLIRLEAPVMAALALACLSGMAAMMDEVGYNRVLCMILGGSTYAFSAMLASFLTGLSAGAFAFSQTKTSRALPYLAGSQLALGLVVVLTGYSFDHLWLAFMGLAQAVYHFRWDLDEWQKAIQFLLAFGVLFPTAFLCGAVFPLVLKIHPWFSKNPGEKVGLVYGANTLGAIAGSLLAAFLLIPLLGVRQTLAAGACLNLAGAGLLVLSRKLKTFPRAFWAGAVLVILALPPCLWALLPDWNRHNLAVGPYFQAITADQDYIPAFKERLSEARLLFYKEGMVSTVTVEMADELNIMVLSNNGKVEASSVGDLGTEQLASHLPLVWREASLKKTAGRVAVIGLASGITSGAALRHEMESLDVVELEPFMPQAAALFKDYNFGILTDPKFHFITDDARHYLRVTPNKYDVIISEPSNPWISGISNLFTKEAYEIGKNALTPDGVYCQWVQIYGMRTSDVKTVCRTFSSVFPYVYVFGVPPRKGELKPVPDLFFLGSARELTPDPAYMEKILGSKKLRGALERINMSRAGDLLSTLRMGPAESGDFCRDSPLNTDDNGLVEFSAPLHLYDGDCFTANMLEVRSFQADLGAYLGEEGSPAWGRLLLQAAGDLKDYWGNDLAAGLRKEAGKP